MGEQRSEQLDFFLERTTSKMLAESVPEHTAGRKVPAVNRRAVFSAITCQNGTLISTRQKKQVRLILNQLLAPMICYIIPIQRSYLGLTLFASTVVRTAQAAALPRLDRAVMKQRKKKKRNHPARINLVSGNFYRLLINGVPDVLINNLPREIALFQRLVLNNCK